MNLRKLLVFDLETVPDVQLGRALHPEWAELEDISVRAKLSAAALEKTQGKSDFLPPVYHKIVAISCVMAEVESVDHGEIYHFRKVGTIGTLEDDEEALIRKFLEFGAKEKPRLVSFNGLNFDLPALRIRAMKYGISSAWPFRMVDKWKNHFAKSSPEYHEDLQEILGGNRGGLKLDEACKLVGLPGKLDVSGAWVADLMADGQLQAVRDYCETDVLNTYLLYLRYQNLCGVFSTEALAREEHRVVDYLVAEGEKRKHLREFLDAWGDFAPPMVDVDSVPAIEKQGD